MNEKKTRKSLLYIFDWRCFDCFSFFNFKSELSAWIRTELHYPCSSYFLGDFRLNHTISLSDECYTIDTPHLEMFLRLCANEFFSRNPRFKQRGRSFFLLVSCFLTTCHFQSGCQSLPNKLVFFIPRTGQVFFLEMCIFQLSNRKLAES